MMISPVPPVLNVCCNTYGKKDCAWLIESPCVSPTPDQNNSLQLCEYWNQQLGPTPWVSNLSILCTSVYLSALPLAKTLAECVAISLALWCTGIGVEYLLEGVVSVRWKCCSRECALLSRHFCSIWSSKCSLKVVWQDLHSFPNTTSLLNKSKGPEVQKHLCMWSKQTFWCRGHVALPCRPQLALGPL